MKLGTAIREAGGRSRVHFTANATANRGKGATKFSQGIIGTPFLWVIQGPRGTFWGTGLYTGTLEVLEKMRYGPSKSAINGRPLNRLAGKAVRPGFDS